MRNLCRPKQLEIEMYFNKLRDTYDSYEDHHNPMMGHYRALREKDDFYQRDIARNERLIEQATVRNYKFHGISEFIRKYYPLMHFNKYDEDSIRNRNNK